MKVLIVDDERHAREAAKLLVPWESFGISEILEAENGEEAKSIIQAEHPSIILTDMHMPVADGMKLIEWVSGFEPSAKLIVISGYNDFRYVRHTLRHGGIDYLLKPIDPAQLQDAVKQALDQLAEERQEKQRQIEQGITMNQYKPVYRDHLLGQLVHSRADNEPAIRQLREQFPKLADAVECRAALFPLRPLMNKLLQRFSGDRDLAVYAIQNVLNGLVMQEWNEGCAFRCPDEPEQLAILLWGSDDRSVADRVRQLVEALRSTFKLPFYAAVSGARPFPACAFEAFESARRVLMQRNLLNAGASSVLTENDDYSSQADLSSVPDLTALAEPIRLAMLGRDETTLRDTIASWFDAVGELPVITPAHIERWRKQLDVAAAQWQRRAGADGDAADEPTPQTALPFLFEEDGTLSLRRTQEQWIALLLGEADRLARLIRQERNIIREMTDYIGRHLEDDLSLQQLASRFFLSREYVSRKFRQETGVTLSEYVERLRMEKATMLLANRAYKIADIAEMVGYADEKYFSKVFKKHTGLSPQQHRKHETP